MIGQMLQATVGRHGAWEDWGEIATEEDAARAARLVAKRPGLWRIV